MKYYILVAIIDLVLSLFACIFGERFVNITYDLMQNIGLTGMPINLAYVILFITSSALFSSIRNSISFSNKIEFLIGSVFNITVVSVGAVMLWYLVERNTAALASKDVVTPYWSYLLSLFICAAVGNALSNVVFSLKKKKPT